MPNAVVSVAAAALVGGTQAEEFTEPQLAVTVAAALVVLITGVLLAVIATRSRPRRPPEAPATMDLGEERPAVAGLLTNGFRFSPSAVPATLIDLAARRWVEIDEIGDQRFVRVRSRPGQGDLTPYERQVLDHVAELAVDGRVPTEALTTGEEHESRAWWKRYRQAVRAEVTSRGLARPRWGALPEAVATAGTLVAGGLLYVALVLAPEQEPTAPGTAADTAAGVSPAGVLFILAVVAVVGLGWVTGVIWNSDRLRDTPSGLRAASRWLGVRRWLEEQGDFKEKPAVSAALWERYLAYATAMGLAPLAGAQLPLEIEDDHEAWSRATGQWRRVQVRYPAWPPGGGYVPGRVAVRGLIGVVLAVAAGYVLVRASGEVDELAVSPTTEQWIATGLVATALLMLPILAWYGIKLVLGLADLTRRDEVEGVVVRRRKRRAGEWLPRPIEWLLFSRQGAGDPRQLRSYVAVDDGTQDRVAAWRVFSPGHYVRQGARVRARVSPRLGYVEELETVGETSAPPEVPVPGTFEPSVERAAEEFVTGALDSLDGLQGLHTEDGTPLLDVADDEGVTLGDRLREARQAWEDRRSQGG